MKFKQIILSWAIVVLSSMIAFSQNIPVLLKSEVIDIPKNTAPCLSDEQRQNLETNIEENIEKLRTEGNLQTIDKTGAHPLFDWPVSQAAGFNYNSIWYPSNYVDHNPAFPYEISDYNCGSNSYDTPYGYNHPGFDIVVWPFSWKQMERNQAINIAAADGQIIVRRDGHFDRNCSFNNNPWNGIILLHSDGSRSYYLHMKNGSVTTKQVGEFVARGEYLGVVGSSGSSNIPHLHFEVRNSNNQLIDPSIGPCNNLNSDTWWVSQKPYKNPGIMAVLTHDGLPEFPPCPQVEIIKEKNHFDSGVPYYLGVYFRDGISGTNLQFKVIRPNNSIFQQWIYPISPHDYFYYIFSGNSDMDGVWTFEVTYEGQTARHNYYIGKLNTVENELTNTSIFPNPSSSEINILSDHTITEVSLFDVLGRTVSEMKNFNGIKKTNVESLPNGIYFIKLTSDTNKTKVLKILKQ